MTHLPTLVISALLVVNLSAMLFMAIDKRAARRNKQRIPEKTLFALALCGGAAGGTLGMWLFRHKTKHWYFKFGFPILWALQIAALIFLLHHFGADLIRSVFYV